MKFPLLLSVTFLLLLGSRPVWSQTNGEVAVIGRAQPGKILLRWAPTKSAGWVYANQYGYTLERITMFRNGEAVVPVERVVLGISRPAPEAEWEPLIENDYAAVAAQALYGETFELSQNYDEDIMQIVNKAQEQDQRWSFALFAADQDYQVAQMCGLAFTDEGVRPGEQYLYQVYANIPPLIYPLDTGSVYISLEDYAPLPQPREVSGVFGDGAVLLRWNRVFFEETYNSFIIERSEDGGQSFYEISEDPLVNAYVEENPNARYYYKLDSIENGKNYAYRIRGLTSFGEKGPPSDTIRGVGVPTIETRAQITGHEILPNGAVALSWAFDKPTEVLIDGFVVERSPQANGPFVPVSPLLGKSTRFYQDDAAMGATYYRVSLKADDNVVNPGFPYLVQPEDSIPPAIPVDLTYTLDSAGAFALTWAQNTEPDLQGYRIYQSNFENSEFVQITQEPVSQAQWLDSLNLKTLTRTQYYQVAAVDVHNNTSDRSAILRVEKPDVVPPIRPVFQPPTADSLGIHLQWVASVSTDVVSHTLYR
ncbi:MAG TPA: hypothetical protein DCR93_10020, partial [Cytophagales bacterium]|nr:hypothetical protein [Cytophagales bacterium]